MFEYGTNQHKHEHMDLYPGIHRKAAADVPPSSENNENIHEDLGSGYSFKSKLLDELIDDFFDGKIDNDKLLIGALMYMLIKEGADMKLIIDRGYILM